MFSSKTSVYSEFLKLLDSGSGYVFAFPFLFSSGSFIFLEKKRKETDDLRSKLSPNIYIYCFLFVVFTPIFTGIHFSALLLDPSISRLILNIIQVLITLLTIFLGFHLFCLKNVDKLPDELKNYLLNEEKKVKEIYEDATSNDLF